MRVTSATRGSWGKRSMARLGSTSGACAACVFSVYCLTAWAAAPALAGGSAVAVLADEESDRPANHVDDAYVRRTADALRWEIGTNAIGWTYEFKDGALTLAGFQNKTISPPREYIASGSAAAPFTVKHGGGAPWVFRRAEAVRRMAGGMPVAKLVLELERGTLNVRVHAIAYPGTSILRQWVELENTGAEKMTAEATPWSVAVQTDQAAPLTHYWMIGGNSVADQGMMHSAAVAPGYQGRLAGRSTHALMPWTALQRGGGPADGWFMALEYLGNWNVSVERGSAGPIVVSAAVPDLGAVSIEPGRTIELPAVTVGTFSGTLDDLMVRAYDWQYRYQWDYTNIDYYARPKWGVPWTYCAQNLQEQFAARLAFLDMDADLAREVGYEMLWDDAGWSSHESLPPDNYGSVFVHQYEGPDFRLTRRYLDKMGMGWLAWFCGRPAPGIIAGKVGAWGDFEWRTDGVALPDWAADRDLRGKIARFLDRFPRSSFHTCSGGSAYSHTFEIQRYANTNYFSDAGRGPQTNYYFSYLEPPDKWVDVIEPWASRGAYRPETARQLMTMVPMWGLKAPPHTRECLRKDLDLFRFLRREGVAGRWSYMFHPIVKGDEPIYYAQRTGYDRTKACVIFKHRATGPIVIFPQGLLPEHRYAVEFAVSPDRAVRTGADLMANGIAIASQAPGELIFLGLPNRPGSGRDTAAPAPPPSASARRESNIGHAGVGVYWSAGKDDNWISYYEVKRGDRILGKASIGAYFFDHAQDWDTAATYAVRTVDGDGNASAWTPAATWDGEPDTYSALGGLFPIRGRDGWSADTTADGVTLTPMVWVQPPKTSSADEGGTPNQPGGIEGWWGGPGGARLGRAWMQSSRDAACVRTWIAPRSGTVRLVGRVMKEWYSQSFGVAHRVRILRGTKQIWPERDWAAVPLKDLTGATHDVVADVAAGDAIRFVLDRRPAGREASLRIGESWTVFGPCDRDYRAAPAELTRIPDNLAARDRPLSRHVVAPANGVLDLGPLLGGVQEGRCAYVFIPLHAPRTDRYRLGFGVEGWYCAWLDGTAVSDTATIADFMAGRVTDPVALATGRDDPPASRESHPVNLLLSEGDHVLALRYVSGGAGSRLDVGIPESDEDDIIAWTPRIVYADGPKPRGTESAVRILCGAAQPYTDATGNVWSADRCFHGGEAVQNGCDVRDADDPAIYRCGRRGRDFAYDIPVEKGLYAVRLRFAEPDYEALFARPFHVEVNGREMLRNFDICQAARGFRKAHDRVFRYVVPNAEGRIALRFSAGFDPGQRTDEALVQAIEILPENKPALRIACGSQTDFVDWNGFIWSRDRDALEGEAIRSTRPVTQATPTRYDQALYQTARHGREILYRLPVPPGLYDVHLKFAELWLSETGRRPMDIEINGRPVWRGWDPAAEAGQCGMAIDLRTSNVTPDRAGRITIGIRAAGDQDAIIQGIEVE